MYGTKSSDWPQPSVQPSTTLKVVRVSSDVKPETKHLKNTDFRSTLKHGVTTTTTVKPFAKGKELVKILKKTSSASTTVEPRVENTELVKRLKETDSATTITVVGHPVDCER